MCDFHLLLYITCISVCGICAALTKCTIFKSVLMTNNGASKDIYIFIYIFCSTSFCVLKGTFPASAIDPYSGDLGIDEDVAELPAMTMKEAAECAAPTMNVWVCSCHTDCSTRRCPCKNHGKHCTSDCHGSKKCSNSRFVLKCQICIIIYYVNWLKYLTCC